MQASSEFPIGLTRKNQPLTNSVFTRNNTDGAIAPGGPEAIATESLINICTEDGEDLITES